MKSGSVVLLFVLAIPLGLWAKRVPPKPVSPVVYDGTKYSAGGDGKVGWVVATDISSSKQLWTVKIFRVYTHFWKGEEDNQWVFISDLMLVQNAILVKDEKSRCYRLDLATRHVKKERCR
jgi:hypothetical protein